MKPRAYLFVHILSFLFVFSACKKDTIDPEDTSSDTPTENSKNVTFMNEGYINTYHQETWLEEYDFTMEVESEIKKDVFVLRQTSTSFSTIPTLYWKLENDILYSSFRMRDDNNYFVECKFNEIDGASWTRNISGSEYTYLVESNSDTLTIAGQLRDDLVKIKVSSPSGSISYNYYSYSLGYIGSTNSSGSWTVKLTEHEKKTIPTTLETAFPARTFGSFDFLRTGVFWNFEYYDLNTGLTNTIDVKVLTKDSKNIYKVQLITVTSGVSQTEIQYWFEDDDYLMVYDENESIDEADPIFVKSNKAKVGLGWTGKSISGTNFNYKISEINALFVTNLHGEISSTRIDSGTGGFWGATQNNVWSDSKGQIATTGWIYLDLTGSNAKNAAEQPYLGPLNL